MRNLIRTIGVVPLGARWAVRVISWRAQRSRHTPLNAKKRDLAIPPERETEPARAYFFSVAQKRARRSTPFLMISSLVA